MSEAPVPGSSKAKVNVGKALRTQDIDGHDLPPSPAPSTPRNGRKYALMTELVYTESNDQYNASSVPIYQVYRCRIGT
jgi:cystathionine beta-lyase